MPYDASTQSCTQAHPGRVGVEPRPATGWAKHFPEHGWRRQILGFLAVGTICTLASLALFAIIRPFWGTQWANLISLVVTSVLNTELNRRLSWSITSRTYWLRDHIRGLWVMLLALALTSSSLWLLHALIPDPSVLEDILTITVANVIAAATRFLLLRYWIFTRTRKSATR